MRLKTFYAGYLVVTTDTIGGDDAGAVVVGSVPGWVRARVRVAVEEDGSILLMRGAHLLQCHQMDLAFFPLP